MRKKQERNTRAAKQVVYLSDAEILDEHHGYKLVLIAIVMVSVLIIAFAIWASLTHLDEIAVTTGEVIPLHKIPVAQHLEGGIVKRVLVDNGEHVLKGQELVELDPTASVAELERLKAKEYTLMLDAKRLRAFTQGKIDEYDKLHNTVTTAGNGSTVAEKFDAIIRNESLLLQTQQLAKEDQKAVLLAQVSRHKESLKLLADEKKTIMRQIVLLNKEKAITEELVHSQLVSQPDYLKILREINLAKGDLAKINGQTKQTQEEFNEAQHKLKELNSTLKETAMKQLVEVTAELLQIKRSIEKLSDQVSRLHVRAPVDGIVKGLEVTVGSVISPGGILLELVPSDDELIVDAEISPKDIGHVKVGDPVRVKVTTYDYVRYGAIDGVLKSISASTFLNQEGVPFYRGRIRLAHQYVGTDPNALHLLPGMSVQADIITGEKTLMQYLLKPIHITMSSAFAER